MKQRLYDFIPVKHLCVGMSLCGIVAGTQNAQASPVFGQSSGLELPSPSIYQQSTKQISGIVKDQAGIPVIGANVIVKGTTNGVITGLDGDFLLEVPENATLEISYIGYRWISLKKRPDRPVGRWYKNESVTWSALLRGRECIVFFR